MGRLPSRSKKGWEQERNGSSKALDRCSDGVYVAILGEGLMRMERGDSGVQHNPVNPFPPPLELPHGTIRYGLNAPHYVSVSESASTPKEAVSTA